MIDKTGYGMIAFINPHGFLDNTTFRGMRYSLLKSFDKIYTLDLHGNSNKKETCPDGSKDENVFDIKQGVSINIFIKTTKSKKEAKVYHYDLYGKRDFKYNFLDENSLNSIKWSKLELKKPNYFFVPKDFSLEKEYNKFINIKSIFKISSMGIATGDDKNLVKFDKNDLKNNKVRKFYYHPFDIRYTVFDNTVLQRARYKLMKNYLKNNLGLNIVRQSKLKGLEILVTDDITNRDFITNHTYNFPLYLYSDKTSLTSKKELNLNQEIIKEFEKSLNLEFVSTIQNSTPKTQNSFNEIDIFDYIYAILHSLSYREKYKEFLKIDFPRVPYPKKENFFTLVEFGRKLRAIHLLDDISLDERTIEIIGEGQMKITNKLNKKDTIIKDDKVEIKLNDDLSIKNIPLIAWEFYIGGYQPAQKWLKDRVGRELSRNDIKHYNRIINALLKTDAIMNEIDEINIA
jgi:predicted helicase